ncbi:MAG: ABC transporter ATP-binding protein, partial [Rhodomicrobium sp.]|nr:ABC transporter ATP-binding protein [Rhodomicrobium sp.]
MLTVEGLHLRYGKVNALRGVSLTVERGEIVALIGANGAGKTTTLKAISGIVRPFSGRITLDGAEITRASPRDILAAGIAHCPEGRRIFPHLTVRDNLELGAYLRKGADGIAADMERLLARFPILAERSAQIAGTLSGGEQQMLAISRALMSRPKLILFDEPSLGLAPKIDRADFRDRRRSAPRGRHGRHGEQNAFA